jgi:hypothetical protein
VVIRIRVWRLLALLFLVGQAVITPFVALDTPHALAVNRTNIVAMHTHNEQKAPRQRRWNTTRGLGRAAVATSSSNNSGSFSGGGTADGVPFKFNIGQDTNPSGACGFFLSLSAYPVTDTTLIDYNFGAQGYVRIKLTSTGRAILEASAQGETLQTDMAGAAIPLNTVVYLTFTNIGMHGIGQAYFTGGIYLPDGSVLGSGLASYASGSFENSEGTPVVYKARFGWGVSTSSAYANFPQTGLGWMSKFRALNTVSVLSPPSGDTSGDIQDYMVRQPDGLTTRLVDSSGNSYDLTVGPQGLGVNAIGPYASAYISAPPAVPVSPQTYGSESFSGGGTASGVPLVLNVGLDGNIGGSCGFYLYLTSYPNADTTLVDYNLGGSGYLRVKLTPSGHAVLEFTAQQSPLTADMAGAAIPLNTIVYVTFTNRGVHGIGQFYFQGGVYLPGERLLGSGLAGYANGPFTSGQQPTYTTHFGWGVSTSSAYANFPRTGLGWMSKFRALNSFGLLPTDGDTSGDTQDYMVRQPLGRSAGLIDSSGNDYHLVAGPQGATINLDGPYVSPFTPLSLSVAELLNGQNPSENICACTSSLSSELWTVAVPCCTAIELSRRRLTDY